MADIRIKDLPTNNIVPATDFVVFESSAGGGNYTTSKNTFNSFLNKYDSVYTQVNSLSSAWPYRTGDTITEIIHLSVADADGTISSNATTLAGSERASFILDLGNISKWRKSGCSAPTITWYLVGRTTNALSFAEWDLFNRATGLSIAGSNITTTSTATWNLNSIVIPQANFPSAMSVVAIRSRIQSSAHQVETYSSMIEVQWTVL